MSGTVVVSGLSVASPNGLGTQDYWSATTAGRSGIGPVSRFDASSYPAGLAGEVPGFVAEDHLPGRLLPQTDRMTRLALVVADWALADAGVRTEETPAYDMGVATASSSGGFEFGQNELRALWSKGSQYVSAYQSFAWFYAVNTGQISIRNGMKGPGSVVVSDQAGGLDAVAQARRQVRKGIPMVLTGGSTPRSAPGAGSRRCPPGGSAPPVTPTAPTSPSTPRPTDTYPARAERSSSPRTRRRHTGAAPAASARSPATGPRSTRPPTAAGRRPCAPRSRSPCGTRASPPTTWTPCSPTARDCRTWTRRRPWR